ncbi:MAG: PQQ-dependent sugar dehydrogenase [Burkholderiaceae bacterium]
MKRLGWIGLLFLLLVIIAAFGMGQRSVIKRDKLYYLSRDAKAWASHEYRQVVGSLKLRGPKELELGRQLIFQANDFELDMVQIPEYGRTEKTAGFVGKKSPRKIEQADIFTLFTEAGLDRSISDAEPTSVHGGGLKQVIEFQGDLLGLASMKSKQGDCFFASLVNFTRGTEVFRAPCVPNNDFVDFNSLGGAYLIEEDGNLLMSLGTPASDEQETSMLAQKPDSPYGKFLRFPPTQLLGQSRDIQAFKVHSSGHRNPQGLVRIGQDIYVVDHGPKGGDKINHLIEGKNYGWPLYHLGSHYAGEPYPTVGDPAQFEPPLYSFIPSVAPADMAACPPPLAQRYQPFNCVMISTLRGNSLIIALIDSHHRVASLERIDVGMRLREFFQVENGTAVSTDGEGAFRLDFAPDFAQVLRQY